MWYQREISEKILVLAKKFPVIILTGARQTGKTSVLKYLFPNYHYVSLDVPQKAELAEHSPEEFLRHYKTPLIVDEVQYAPKLFRHLKTAIDENRHQMGQYILTGSQKFVLMREVADSLAGRCVILELETLSVSEVLKDGSDYNIFELISRGGFPDLWRDKTIPVSMFYDAYLSSYIERDVRQILNISNLRDFDRFIRVCATRSAQLIDKNSIASDLGISNKTVNSWLSVLQASNQIVLLEPWYTNIGKRVIKSPKLYFCDTGLAVHLLGLSRDDLPASPYLGALWETLVFSEMRKNIHSNLRKKNIWFYRDNQAKEIDFLLQDSGKIQLLECKLKEHPSLNDAKTMHQILDYAQKKKMPEFDVDGCYVICRTPVPFSIDAATTAIGLKDLKTLWAQ